MYTSLILCVACLPNPLSSSKIQQDVCNIPPTMGADTCSAALQTSAEVCNVPWIFCLFLNGDSFALALRNYKIPVASDCPT